MLIESSKVVDYDAENVIGTAGIHAAFNIKEASKPKANGTNRKFKSIASNINRMYGMYNYAQEHESPVVYHGYQTLI